MERPVENREITRCPTGLKIGLTLAFAEGAAAFFLLLASPSESRNSLLPGLSPTRLLLVLLVLAASGALAWAVWRAWRDEGWLLRVSRRLDQLVHREGAALFILLFGLAFLFLSGFIAVFGTNLSHRVQDFLLPHPAWLTHAVDLLHAAAGRAYPLLGWALLLCLQALIFIAAVYPRAVGDSWRSGAFLKILVLLLMTGLSLFHWAVLLFQLKTFMVIPGWKWYITPKEFHPYQAGLYLVLLALAVVVIRYILSRSFSVHPMIPMLILLGYILQVGMGFVAGGGFESIRQKYADSIFNGYARAAAEQPPLYHTLKNFETIYASDHYLGTKPPGILIPYVATEKLASLLSPSATAEERFFKLTRLAAYTYPFIAFLVLPVLAYFSRSLVKEPADSILPAVVYILLPNVILIPLFLDQVLYPLLFMLILAGALRSLDQPSFIAGFFIGAGAYIALYFSFSLLALLPLIGMWVVLEWLRRREPGLFRQSIRFGAGVLAGILLSLAVFRVGLNYDIFTRYTNAFSNHSTTWHFANRQEQIRHALVLNNAEFVTFSGFPIALLVLIRLGKAAVSFVRREATRLDSLAIAFLIAYILLVALGQTNGEVQRLYLFLMPLVALFSAEEMKSLVKNRSAGFLFLAVLQLITTFLLFQLQDFYG